MNNAEQVDILDTYTDYIDPTEYIDYDDDEWEAPCDCWCEICGCHGVCTDDEDWNDYEEEDE